MLNNTLHLSLLKNNRDINDREIEIVIHVSAETSIERTISNQLVNQINIIWRTKSIILTLIVLWNWETFNNCNLNHSLVFSVINMSKTPVLPNHLESDHLGIDSSQDMRGYTK